MSQSERTDMGSGYIGAFVIVMTIFATILFNYNKWDSNDDQDKVIYEHCNLIQNLILTSKPISDDDKIFGYNNCYYLQDEIMKIAQYERFNGLES